MTSGNVSDEPIACDNDDAMQRLGGIADLFVVHDRDIHDAVRRFGGDDHRRHADRAAARPRLRPRPVPLARGFRRPVLACGAQLKNTFCIGVGTQRVARSAHRRSRQPAHLRSYTRSIELLERFLGVHPQVVAHDLHPDYLSTQYARSRAGAIAVAVQHHHAHVVSAMAEHGIEGPAIGIAYDGTGYGTDGTMWGGEVLVATAASFQRAATFRALPLAGGDRAIQEPWRIALALVLDAFGGEVPPTPAGFRRRADRRSGGVQALLTRAACGAAGARVSDGTSTRSARSFWAGPTRATRARWPSSGIRSPTRV
jgi:hydrogenase maturation protein HypF